MMAMRVELEQVKQKYVQLKRNFETVSSHAAKEAQATEKVQQVRD